MHKRVCTRIVFLGLYLPASCFSFYCYQAQNKTLTDAIRVNKTLTDAIRVNKTLTDAIRVNKPRVLLGAN